MLRKYLVLLIGLMLVNLNLIAQIKFDDVDLKSKRSILGLYHYLLENPTDTSQLKDTTGKQFEFYDRVVNRYFDKVEMHRSFVKFGYSHNLQHEILRGTDLSIDSLKADSIFVMSGKQYQSKYGDEIGQNMEKPGRFIAGVLQAKGSPRALLDISFDSNGKFIYIVPIIHFQ